ncbi:penicillin-binding transpeptidase domain-containing protein [Streptacidiphilus sp. PB12-B1b]|uniref:penicillin-binding transpeptidase domain-containing protein n=1 Tax=Streptacidiphilus sp. PB12-B1b TaxID=2705012 RepID=UPI001CDBEBA0|nr:penicillin-binding transpeptidase domain-containing protein [Streptacidiphilus sp. PB12-B1b]
MKIGVIGTCGVALAAMGSLGAYNLVHGMSGSSSDTDNGLTASEQSTTPPAADQAVKTAQAFLADWQAGPGRYAAASQDTNAPSTAKTDLTGYGTGLGLTSIVFGPVASAGPSLTDPGASSVTFTVTAKVKGGTWSYPDKLNVVQNNAGKASVDWSSASLYPGLQAGDTLAAGPVPATATTATVLANDGRTQLTSAAYPSLQAIATTIAHSGASQGAAASSGSGIAVVNAAGTPVTTLKVFTAPQAAKITTTIDPAIQATAERAVKLSALNGMPAATVVLDWRTGNILAVAYANTGSEGDTALLAELAPGSTMKIITAATLFQDIHLTPSTPAPCQSHLTAGDSTFKNDFDQAYPNATIEQGFAMSCNTSFIKDGFDNLVQTSPVDTHLLGQEATDVFGMNGNWSIGGGVATANPSVPVNTDVPTATADLIGQGKVLMSPLALASIAATVRDDQFRQPRILPGQAQTPAAAPLDGTTDGYLRSLMFAAAHDGDGTATPDLGSFADAGAKTGTSQVNGPDGSSTLITNGWFTAYNSRIAVAALVQGGATGAGTAGLIAKELIGATE